MKMSALAFFKLEDQGHSSRAVPSRPAARPSQALVIKPRAGRTTSAHGPRASKPSVPVARGAAAHGRGVDHDATTDGPLGRWS